MHHVLTLLLILLFLIVYSNTLTSGFWIYLTKRKLNWGSDLKLFIAFSLSITTIFLLLILPHFIFNYYPLSLTLLALSIIMNIWYSLKNRDYLKINFKIIKKWTNNHRLLLGVWIGAIVLMVIPAIHYPWYFGYGVDWVNHLSIINDYIVQSKDIFYPAINVHLFLSILNIFRFPYPEVFQIGSAYLLSLSVLPFYFIAKSLLPSTKMVGISLLLWLILPYNHLLYGEFIPNATSVFFFFTFFMIMIMILKQGLSGAKDNTGLLSFLGGISLACAVYNHQVFLYTFFFIYLLITLLYLPLFRRIKYVSFTYTKILGLATVLLLPFLSKLYSGAQVVLHMHDGKKTSYDIFEVLAMFHNSIGLITVLIAFFGTCLYCFHYARKKTHESKFNAIVVASLLFGNLIAANVYFDGNPFWSERGLYVLGVTASIPIAYLFGSWFIRFPKRFWKIFFCIFFLFILGTRIEYAFNIDPLWSTELQSSIEWGKSNQPLIKDKKIHLVFEDPAISSVNQVFRVAFHHRTQLPIELISKKVYSEKIKDKKYQVLLDNNFYEIVLQENNLYLDYKVEAIKSGDALYFSESLLGKPKLIYTLDSMLRRYFLDKKIDQQSKFIKGSGLVFNEINSVGQTFITTKSHLDQICLFISKGDLEKNNEPSTIEEKIWLELYQGMSNNLLLRSDLSRRKLAKMLINHYQEYCFDTEMPLVAGASYRFELKTNAKKRSYGARNAGSFAYPFGTTYLNGRPINDDLLFSTKYFAWRWW